VITSLAEVVVFMIGSPRGKGCAQVTNHPIGVDWVIARTQLGDMAAQVMI
jgi:hypothetical protein